jgi:signal transduction histidine kinase
MSIKAKIFLCLLIFCSALIALLWLFQVVFLGAIYQRVKTGEVRAAMNALAASLDGEDLQSVADGLYESKNIDIDIMHGSGGIIYSSGRNGFSRRGESLHEASRLYLLTLENGGEYLERPRTGSQAGAGPPPRGPLQTLYYSRLINKPSGDVFIILTAMISPVEATVGTLRVELAIVTALMLLFSLLLALLISRHVSRPIVSLGKSAKTLAAGRYDAVFDAKGYREIKELSDTLSIAAKELSSVDGLRRELVANISHDLRTPLTLIAGYAEAMRDLPGEDTPENAQIIVDEANRLNRLVSDVLNLSKLQSGAQEICPAPFSLTQTLRETALRLSEFTKANGYAILFEANEDITVTADESSISQAIYNLLINALNFTGEDRTVTLRQAAGPDSVTVEVVDSGKGVTPEEMPYIWDRYYRTGAKHKRAAIGTGIGLSIVKSIMELHGGAYGARSELGCGSVFWIRLKR